MAKGCTVEAFSTQSLQQLGREQPTTAIAREESDISQLDCRGFGRHLETPTTLLDDLAGPSEREGNFRIGEPPSRFHIHDDRTGVPDE